MALFTKVTNGPLTFKNRIAMAPLTRGRAGITRIPNQLMAEYYTQRASAGLIFAEATSISEQAIGWIDSPGIYTQEHVEGWKKVTKSVKNAGGHIFLQLWHVGRSSHSSFRDDKSLPVSASAIAINGEAFTPNGVLPYETPRALETEEVSLVVKDFKRAAKLAKEAGFDGVEIHGANGYLIDQFLQSKSNKRTDRYGGSLENRFRFLGEVAEAVLSVWDKERVSVRLSPNGVFNDMGSEDYRETAIYTAQQLNDIGVGMLHVMDGTGFGFHKLGEPVQLSEIRPFFKGLLVGNVDYTKETAEKRINDGDADIIAFGRPYISNPDLVERFKNGWELTPVPAPEQGWYSKNPPPKGEKWYEPSAEGYTDFKKYGEK